MGRLLEIITPLHRMTKRDYLARMVDDKVHCMLKAKEYEADYWDGDRRYGYGGYRFIEGRWTPVAQALIDIYGLKRDAKILDVGCGKAFLLYELKRLLPDAEIVGFDVSRHGLGRRQGGGTAGPVPLSGAGSLSVRRQALRSRDLADLPAQPARYSSCRPRCRRSSASARASTSWSRAIATSASSSICSAGR